MGMHLMESHRKTYEAVFQHPVARNLKWMDLRSMLMAHADTVQEYSDVLRVSCNGKTLILHRPARNTMGDIGILMKVRLFLEQSAAALPNSAIGGVGDRKTQSTELLTGHNAYS